MTPVPMASRIRPSRMTTKVGPSQASIEPAVNTSMEVMTICRVVNRRVRYAVSGTMTPMTSWNTEVSHCPVVTLMWKSLTMVGNAELSCNWVKLPTKVMKVRMIREMNAVRLRCPSTYASAELSVLLEGCG